MDEKTTKKVEEIALKTIRDYMKSSAFTDRKLTDMPNDNLSVVSRKYVNLNGTSANRPVSSVLGQQYFDTTLGYPVFWNGSAFVDGQGNVV